MSQLRVIGLIGLLIMFIGGVATMGNPGGIGLIGIGGAMLGFSVFMMFSEIHEVITEENAGVSLKEDADPTD